MNTLLKMIGWLIGSFSAILGVAVLGINTLYGLFHPSLASVIAAFMLIILGILAVMAST